MSRPRSRQARQNVAGFTLIELLLSISIIGIVLGAVSSAFIVFLKNSEYTLFRDDHSGGAIVASTYLNRDFASADTARTTPNSICSGGTNVNKLLLTWSQASATVADPQPDPVGGGTFAAAYYLTADNSSEPIGSRYKLERAYCVNGSLVDRSVLVVNLASADFTGATTTVCGTPPAPTPAPVPIVATLKNYGDASDAASDYTYTGCLKGRLR